MSTGENSMCFSIGIDIGSTSTKTAVLDENGTPALLFVQPTGWSSVDTAEAVRQHLIQKGYNPALFPCVATGYGRVAVPYADKAVTEITCHARGAMLLHGSGNLTVIDIGGQDTKIIRVQNGKIIDFIMNDKCSAGTGRFLEIMANTMGLRPDTLCDLASRGGSISISSMCTVFAESEVISLIGKGESRENIAFAVVDSIVKKVASQAGHLDMGNEVCLTGGLCQCGYVLQALGTALNKTIIADANGRYAGAIGAALAAREIRKKAAPEGLMDGVL